MARVALTVLALSFALALPAAAGAANPPVLGQPAELVSVGPGVSESSIRQAVRTLSGRVYIVAVDDFGNTATPGARIRMYRAGQVGIPTSFAEVDAAHAPVIPSSIMSGGDARLDRQGVIHLSYFRRDTGAVVHQTFSTLSDSWGAAETVASPPTNWGDRGGQVTGLALDRAGTVFVAFSGTQNITVYRRNGPSTWSAEPVATVPSGYDGLHPSITVDRQDRLHLAWLEHGAQPRIRYSSRAANGAWSTPETVAGSDVLSNSTYDQSPSLAVDASNRPVVLFLNGADLVRVRLRTGTGSWVAEDPATPQVYSHTPGIYLRGDDRYVLLGHDAQIHPSYLTRAASASEWSDVTIFDPPGTPAAWAYDGSGNARFDPQYETDCTVVDGVFFDENSDTRQPGKFLPDLYYGAIRLAGPASGNGSCRELGPGGGPSGDRTAPLLDRLRLNRSRFRVARSAAARRAPRGAQLSFTLSEPARVTLTIARRLPGRRKGKSCVTPGRRRHGKRCTRLVNKGQLSLQGASGSNSNAFSGRVGGRALGAGSYSVVAVATDPAGNSSAGRSARFTIVRR